MHPAYQSPLTGIVIGLTKEQMQTFQDGMDGGALALSTRLEYAQQALEKMFGRVLEGEAAEKFSELLEDLGPWWYGSGYDEMSEKTRRELDSRLLGIQNFLETHGHGMEEYMFTLQQEMSVIEEEDLKEVEEEMRREGTKPGVFTEFVREIAAEMGVDTKPKSPGDVVPFDPSKGGKGRK